MNLKTVNLLIVFSLATALLALFSGCSGDSSAVVPVISSTASTECVGCHAANSKSISSTSGVRITEQWQLSAHNTAHGAGCLDCHSTMHFHDNAVSCRSCHATAHANRGNSCNLCHGTSSAQAANCTSCHGNVHANMSDRNDSCNRCHGGAIPIDVAMKNPDFAGKCIGCHDNGSNFKRYTAVGLKHFNSFTSVTHSAMYVATNYRNSCTSCHEPHNPLLGSGNVQRKAWAKSGHGDVNGVAWATEDFKENASCIRCHTATGFINFVQSNFTLPATTWATAGDSSREVLTCKVCHTSSNFKATVRKLPAFTAPYGISNFVATVPTAFPDVGESNLCIPCHSAREDGASLKRTVTNFKNASFKNPHYLPAAAVFYGKGGFQYYSSAGQTSYFAQAYSTKYGVVADGVIIPTAVASSSNSTPAITVGSVMEGERANWSHGKLGMNNFQTTKTAAIVSAKGALVFTGTNGQCITCHLGSGANPGLHSLSAFDVAESTWRSAYKGCYGCHTNEDIREVAELDEKPKFDRAMAFFQWQLIQKGLYYSDTNYPYFYTAPYDAGYTEAGSCSSNLPVKNWQSGGTSTFTWNTAKSTCDSSTATAGTNGTGPLIMGAAMNFKLLMAEKGAHVHNRTYMKQLIFDSVQYLQKGTVTFSSRYIASGSATLNNVINFSSYSAAVTPVGGGLPNDLAGNSRSISDLKSYIVRKNTSGATGGTSTVPVYTRN